MGKEGDECAQLDSGLSRRRGGAGPGGGRGAIWGREGGLPSLFLSAHNGAPPLWGSRGSPPQQSPKPAPACPSQTVAAGWCLQTGAEGLAGRLGLSGETEGLQGMPPARPGSALGRRAGAGPRPRAASGCAGSRPSCPRS